MTEEQQPQKTNTTTKPGSSVSKPRRKRGGLFNLILLVGIVVLIGLFAWAELERRSAKDELQETARQLEELQQASQQSGQEVAQRVLSNLRRHLDVPEDPEPTVATIVDIERLRETNEFYQKAENGDHLIITEDRAILYDPERDIILDIVPVSINRDATPTGDAEADGEGEEGEEGEEGVEATPSPGEEGATASPSPGADADEATSGAGSTSTGTGVGSSGTGNQPASGSTGSTGTN